jgi:hypothetical protein
MEGFRLSGSRAFFSLAQTTWWAEASTVGFSLLSSGVIRARDAVDDDGKDRAVYGEFVVRLTQMTHPARVSADAVCSFFR